MSVAVYNYSIFDGHGKDIFYMVMISNDLHSLYNNNSVEEDHFNRTISIGGNHQELAPPIERVSSAMQKREHQFIEDNNKNGINNGKGIHKTVGMRGKGNGGRGDGSVSSSSSSTSNKSGSENDNGYGRVGVRSSSLNHDYTNTSDKQRSHHHSNESNSDHPSLESTSDSKYNTNNTNNDNYYRCKKSLNLSDGRLPETPKCSTLITAALDNLKDDITYGKHIHNGGNERHHLRLKTVSELVSLGTGFTSDNQKQQFFMEDRNGMFLPTTRSTALQSKDRTVWLEQVPELDLQTSLDFAVIVQKVFTPISNIAFGLLGGVALMQTFMSYSYLQNKHSMHDMMAFIESYYIFARVAPTAFYILLAICIVAVFDRFDLAHLDLRHCSDTLLYRHGWCLLIIYIITLLLTLCTAELDDMLLLYPYDKSFSSNEPELYHRLTSWHTLNISRCIFAVLGWIIIAISQPEDLLLHHLKSIKQFDVQHAKEILVVRSPSTTNNIVY